MLGAFNTILVAADRGQGARDAAALAGRLAPPGASVTEVDAGTLAGDLHTLTAVHGADLLVLGAHRHRHFGLPSADPTRAALRHMPCAVAVAPWGYADREATPICSVGVGYVDDARGRVVLDVARALAWQLDAQVHATTVVPPSNWETADSGIGWRATAAARRMAEIPGVHGAVAEGDPQHALTALSDRVDLLVIGSHHPGALRRVLVGDVARDLAHSSRCPLVVVPHAPPRT